MSTRLSSSPPPKNYHSTTHLPPPSPSFNPTSNTTHFTPYEPGNGAGIGSGYIIHRQNISGSGYKRGSGSLENPSGYPGTNATNPSSPKPTSPKVTPVKGIKYRSAYPLEDSPAWRDDYGTRDVVGAVIPANVNVNPSLAQPQPSTQGQQQNYQYSHRSISNPWTGGVPQSQNHTQNQIYNQTQIQNHKRTNTLPAMRIQTQGPIRVAIQPQAHEKVQTMERYGQLSSSTLNSYNHYHGNHDHNGNYITTTTTNAPLLPLDPPRLSTIDASPLTATLPSPSWVGQSQWKRDEEEEEEEEELSDQREKSRYGGEMDVEDVVEEDEERQHRERAKDRHSYSRHSRASDSQSPPLPPKDVHGQTYEQRYQRPSAQSHRYQNGHPSHHEKHATVSSGGKTRKETHHLGESEGTGYDVGTINPHAVVSPVQGVRSPHDTHPYGPTQPHPSTGPGPTTSVDTWSLVPLAHEIDASPFPSALALHGHFDGIQNGGVGVGGGTQGAVPNFWVADTVQGHGMNGAGGRDRSKSLPDHGAMGNGNGKSGLKFDRIKSFRNGFPFRRHTTKTVGHGGEDAGNGNGGDKEEARRGSEDENEHSDEDHEHDHEHEHDHDHDIHPLQRTVSRGQRFTSRAREVREWMRALGETRPLVWRSKSKKKGKDKEKEKEQEDAHEPETISQPFALQNQNPAHRIRLSSKNEATSWTGKTRLGDLFNRTMPQQQQDQNQEDDIRIEPPSVEQLGGQWEGQQQQLEVDIGTGLEGQEVLSSSSPLLQPPHGVQRTRSRSVHSEDQGEVTEVESGTRSRTQSPPLTTTANLSRTKSPLVQHFPKPYLNHTHRTESPLPAPPPTPPTPPSTSSESDADTERVSDEVAQAPQPTYEIVNRRIVETGTERTVEIATWRERVALEVETSSVGDGNELDVGHGDDDDDDDDDDDGVVGHADRDGEDRGRTVRGRTGGAAQMKEHMSVYFVTSDEYALALAEESKLGAAFANSARSVEHPGLHSRVEYVDYKTLEEARDRTTDITQVGLGSIKPGPMVGSLIYRHNKEKERDRRVARDRENKKKSTPRLPSLPRTSGANSLNTSRRGRDKEEKERERSFARITAPLSDKGKGKERAFIKPPSTNTHTETTSDESSEVPPPVKLSPPPRAMSPSNKSSASSLPPPLNINTYTNGKRTHDPPLSPRLYIPLNPVSTHIPRQPSTSTSRKHLFTSTPIEPKPGSTAPFHPTQSSGSTISTIASHEKMLGGHNHNNSRGSVLTGTTTPPPQVVTTTTTTTGPYRSKLTSPLPTIIIPTSPTKSQSHPTTHHHHHGHLGLAKIPQLAPTSPLLPLLLLPSPPLTHLIPALTSLGITTVAHLRALAEMSPLTRDREVRGEAMRMGVSVVEWAMVVDLGGGIGR